MPPVNTSPKSDHAKSSKPDLHILLVEDNTGDARLVQLAILEARQGYTVVTVPELSQAIKALSQDDFDLILLDLGLPDSQDLDSLRRMLAAAPHTPVVVLTVLDEETRGIQAVREGAQDYLVKREVSCRTLVRTIQYAIYRKRTEHERVELKSRLAEARKWEAIVTLAGGIAHQFNNILAGIRGNAELALYQPGLPGPVSANLQEINRATSRAAKLVQKLSAFSRMHSTRPARVDLNMLLRNMEPEIQQSLGDNIIATTELTSDLHPIRADANHIRQLISNLVQNSRDAMPHGGTLYIHTQNRTLSGDLLHVHPDCKPGPYACIAIRDTGVGIDPNTRARIFEPFFTTKGLATATGLGLSVVQGIVEQHDGWMEVDSSPGQGSTFTVCLPALSTEYAQGSGLDI